MIKIINGAYKTMINHIKDTYPEEGCGALIGTENNIRLIKKVIPIENINKEYLLSLAQYFSDLPVDITEENIEKYLVAGTHAPDLLIRSVGS